jgi:E3 ubiquitin-protein ligase RNF19B
LSLCEHIFHKSCLVSYLRAQIEESRLPLNCPDLACKLEIGDLDLKELLSEEDYGKYSTFALNRVVGTNKDMSWCPTADCKFAFIYEPAEEVKNVEAPAAAADE